MNLENKIKIVTLSVLLPLTLLGLMECSSKEKAHEDQAKKMQDQNLMEKRQAAEDLYIYGYPLVLSGVTADVMTNVEKPKDGKAPLNQMANFRSFPDDTFTEIVTPNADTLYSNAWVDLSSEPVVFSTPATGKRYYLTPMMDAWSNVFFSPGSRTTGNGKATYLIVGPGWNGDVPQGMQKVQAPTNLVWITSRYSCTTAADCKAVHHLQDQVKLARLGQWKNKQKPGLSTIDTDIDMKTPPPKQVAEMEADEFLQYFAEMLKDNPPPAADSAMVAEMAKIGMVPGQDFDWQSLPESTRQAVMDGVHRGQERLITDARSLKASQPDQGWTYNRGNGNWGTDYDKRATVALLGFGANLDEDSVYASTNVDSDGNALNGSSKYKIHFVKADRPPVKGFWSVSLYDGNQHFTKNQLHRFTLGSRNHLKYNKDGSLDIFVQNQAPAKNLQANWLPAPKEDFNLVFRMYWPEAQVLDGTYKIPAIQRVNELPKVGGL